MKKILKFFSPTCGPCRVMSERLKTLKDVEIQDIDITDEDNSSLLEEWKIRTIPTTVVLGEKGEYLAEFKGIVYIERIEEILNGDKV